MSPAGAVEQWLRHQARREARMVTLEDALLGREAGRYAWHRARFFLARATVETLLHALRFWFLWQLLPFPDLVAAFVVTVLARLVASGWWGSLEVLRARVRRLWRAQRQHRVPDEVGRWLRLSFVVATAAAMIGPGWWLAGGLAGDTSFDLLDAYVGAVGLGLAAELPTKTYHSGIYAVRRIYRPLPAIVGVELAGFVVALGLWPWLGLWTFPLAVVFGGAVATGVTLTYTHRLYRFYDLASIAPLGTGLPRLGRADRRETLVAGAAYALTRLDALLVLAAFEPARGASAFTIAFAVAPIVQAGFDWAQLLYFDLKRLDRRWFEALRRRYHRRAIELAFGLGFGLWALAALVGHALVPEAPWATLAAFGPLFVARSALALEQIRAFAERRYGELLASGAGLLGVLLAVRLGADDTTALGCLGVAAFCVWGALVRRAATAPDDDEVVVPLLEWLPRVRRLTSPVRVRSLEIAQGGARGRDWARRELTRTIARRLRGGSVTLVGGRRITWTERVDERAPTEAWILAAGGGLVESLVATDVETDGPRALEAAADRGLLGRGFRRGVHGAPLPTLGELEHTFRARFPDGWIVRADDPDEAGLAELARDDRRGVLREAAYFTENLRTRPTRGRWEVTSYCRAGGVLAAIFLVARDTDRAARRAWATMLRDANLEAASKRV